jgi:acyl dehydratase
MNEPLVFEDLNIGDCWRSRARTITESDVVGFANLTGDYDPLHMDHEFARSTPFGQPVAHGLLGLSLLAGLSSNFPAVHTAAFVEIRQWDFLLPLLIGDTVHAVTEVVGLNATGRRRGRVTWSRQLINQKDEVVQRGIFETLVSTAEGTNTRREAPAQFPGKLRLHSPPDANRRLCG